MENQRCRRCAGCEAASWAEGRETWQGDVSTLAENVRMHDTICERAHVRRAVDSRAVLLGAVATELLELGAAGRTEAVRLARLLRRRLREKLEKLVRLRIDRGPGVTLTRPVRGARSQAHAQIRSKGAMCGSPALASPAA
eukprot:6208936-Pleurochrysis_carterae.AAC.4